MRYLIFLVGLTAALISAVAGESRPVVAIVDYHETNGVVSVKRGMSEALLKAGCLPVVLPEMDRDAAREILARCEAVMIGGGITGQDYKRRSAFEKVVIALADEKALPIVGICHGAQIVNEYFGGSLGDVPKKGTVVHKDAVRFARTGVRAEHDAEILPGDSLMARVFGSGKVRINSSHKYCCRDLAEDFKVTAQAADGVIEAYEHVSRPIYGFQFHPEFYWSTDRRCLDLLRRALTAKKGTDQ